MTEHERKNEKAAEYTFVNRNAGRRSEEIDREAERPETAFDGENQPALRPPGREAKKPLRGTALVLAVQSAIAVLLVAGAAAVRLTGGETAQRIAKQYEQLTEAGAVDLKSLFAPVGQGNETGSGTQSQDNAAFGTEGSDSFAESSGSDPEQGAQSGASSAEEIPAAASEG
ncbi:MAG: hypothetical protein PUC59_07555 [Firmicutes bacterium]|nr:hypothetical protein [Bacillota bacterium]